MSATQPFVDLRLNSGAAQAEEGFWPSFTDIMMVIVMVFLLALVGILVRNFELMEQLRTTMQAEREASAIAHSTAEAKAALAARLDESENELALLRLRLLRTQEESRENLEARRQAQVEVSKIREDRDRLGTLAADLETTNQQQAKNIELLTAQQQTLRTKQGNLQIEIKQSKKKLAALRKKAATWQDRLKQLEGKLNTASQQLAMTRGDYSELKIKYDKLVRPARSTRGKQIVEVRYRRVNESLVVGLKLPNEKKFNRVTMKKLHDQLGKLKKSYPRELYIKILLPEDSGLTYNEAWTFTNKLLSQYDYYYQ